MKKHWKILGIVTLVAILGVAAIGAVALAQDSGSGANAPFNFQEKLREAIANVLGITVDEYNSALDTAQNQVLDEAVSDGVLTQDQADRIQQRAEQGFGPGMGGGFFGPGMDGFGRGFGHGGFIGGPENSLISVAANELGMTVSDLTAELQNGKSIADVASEKGVDTQTIVDAFVAQLKTTLDQAVTDGRITQAQADTMLQQAQERVPDMLDKAGGDCLPGGFRGGRGPGRFQPPSDQDTV
jgi:polyhydroxyalkanoate synthesis regulator phasin